MSKEEILEKCERGLYFNTLRELAHAGDNIDRNPPIGEPKPLTPDHLRGVLQDIREMKLNTTRIYMAIEVYKELLKNYRQDLDLSTQKRDLKNGLMAKFEEVEIYIAWEVPERDIYLIVGVPDDGETPTNGVWVNMGGVVRVQIVSEF